MDQTNATATNQTDARHKKRPDNRTNKQHELDKEKRTQTEHTNTHQTDVIPSTDLKNETRKRAQAEKYMQTDHTDGAYKHGPGGRNIQLCTYLMNAQTRTSRTEHAKKNTNINGPNRRNKNTNLKDHTNTNCQVTDAHTGIVHNAHTFPD